MSVLRVITGSARGVRLHGPEGLHTRPTSARVKEGMFSAVQFMIPGSRVLDLFSGSGQLGIEALSRGAEQCVFVDNDKSAAAIIRQNLCLTKMEQRAIVRQNDAEAFLKNCSDYFHLVLIDAPYRGGYLKRVLQLMPPRLHPSGAILCESDGKEDMPETVDNLRLRRTYRYGSTKVTLYRHKDDGAATG